ncbi:cell division protein FtsQ [Pusillimonas sp.]|uniref:cell division protein FtsQ n=1 Tax=Pusillimonas sp. TaxID=3040095 RepID=UPI0029B410A3|nr:cell division protein FtsQ [Pusillimonas sp.]MDX3895526.1 cell division protein FtsQ [Pusillimonas sp.]
MKPSFFALGLALSASLAGAMAHGAEIKLYPTGPAEDSAFVRFVDGSGAGLRVSAAGSEAAIELNAQSRSTAYMPVAGKSTIQGLLAQGDDKQTVAVDILPSEFVTVLGVKTATGLQVHTLYEEADDFTAVRASIAFYDLNESCEDAGVQVAGRSVFLFEHAEPGKWMRRQVNPVALSVQLVCAGQPLGQPLDLGRLQAGERHSLFLAPGDPADGFFHVRDTVAY